MQSCENQLSERHVIASFLDDLLNEEDTCVSGKAISQHLLQTPVVLPFS